MKTTIPGIAFKGSTLIAAGSKVTSHQHPSFSAWGVAGVIITVICGVAAIQQLTGGIRRRELQSAQDELLREYQLTVDAKEVKKSIEENTQQLDELRRQIQVQLPIQARRDYLRERLDQLGRDLYRDFEEYQSIQRELDETSAQNTIDVQIREVIDSAIVPQRRLSGRRSQGMLVLILALGAINLSPLNLSRLVYSYFNTLGYADYFSISEIALLLVAGIVVTGTFLLLVTPMLPDKNMTARLFKSASSKRGSLICMCASIFLLITGICARQGAYDAQSVSFENHQPIYEIIAGSAFNIFVLIVSVCIGSVLLIRVKVNLRWRQSELNIKET
jgi:hypothetical protein